MKDIIQGRMETHEFFLTRQQDLAFAKLTGDTNNIHYCDQPLAEFGGEVGSNVVHGMLSVTRVTRFLQNDFLEAEVGMVETNILFRRPILVDQVCDATFTILEVSETKKTVHIQCRVSNCNGRVKERLVVDYTIKHPAL
jgi:acyl dehydratase